MSKNHDSTELIVHPERVSIRHSAAEASFEQVEQMAIAIAKSGLFQVKSSAEAMGLMLLCQAEGLHPVEAVRRYHIIQGRPAMRSDAMLAEFQARGGKVRWGERTAESVSATFSHSAGGDVPVTWTFKMAEEARITEPRKDKYGNPTNWWKYPRQMLTARVISEGVRTCLPGVVAGIYTPEEVEDFEPAAPPPRPQRTAQPPADKPGNKRSPAEIVKAALAKYGTSGGWLDGDGKPVKARLDAVKAYLRITGETSYEDAREVAKMLRQGWADFEQLLAIEQEQAEAKRRDGQRNREDAIRDEDEADNPAFDD